MLEIYTKEGWLPITNRQNYYTAYEYDGTQTLCFDISPSDEMYRYIANETPVRNEENRYLIKDINKRKTACTITCSLDMDDWHQNEPYLNTKDMAKFQTKKLIRDSGSDQTVWLVYLKRRYTGLSKDPRDGRCV